MKTISKYLLTNVLGWTIEGSFPNLRKSVIIFAPHTSYWDGLYGKLYFMQSGISYKFLSKKEFFKFPMKYFFKAFGSIPVYKSNRYVNQIVEYFNNSEQLHIVLSPEGHRRKTTHWKKGFYYMACRANVPIVVGYLDYKNKQMGIKGVIEDTRDVNETMKKVANMYQDINAKYPDFFGLDKRYSGEIKNDETKSGISTR